MGGSEGIEQLIRASSHGDRRAFERLYEATAPRLYAVILRIVVRRDWADEILQEVFLVVWRRGVNFDPALGSGLAWLTTVARNRAIDVRRQYGRELTDPDPEPEATPPRADGNPERRHDDLMSFSEERRLHECLEGLDDMPRRAIVCAYVSGMSHAEIATEIVKPVGTVKSWIRRGLQALKDCYQR